MSDVTNICQVATLLARCEGDEGFRWHVGYPMCRNVLMEDTFKTGSLIIRGTLSKFECDTNVEVTSSD
jgi:hypothetical protein